MYCPVTVLLLQLWELYCGRPPWRDGRTHPGSLDPRSFVYALPPGCPQDYASLVRMCMYPFPKASSPACTAYARVYRPPELSSVHRRAPEPWHMCVCVHY